MNRSTTDKHRAIIDAAAELFLQHGYQGVSMDDIAARAGVAKQTVYSRFGSKDQLFITMVHTLTDTASDAVHAGVPLPGPDQPLQQYLTDYAARQLTIVLTPRLMGLRRLVIGEHNRFPELARVLHDRGPGRAMAALTELFRQLHQTGRLTAPDPGLAASHFNWLVMGEAVNRAMLLGDSTMPDARTITELAEAGARVFLTAYGTAPRQAAQ